MSNLNPEENALYRRAADLHPLHWERLRARGLQEAKDGAGATLEDGDLLISLLGRVLRVRPGEARLWLEDEPGREVGYQRALTTVSYLTGAQDLPLKGDWVSFRELPGGDSFFRGPHALATQRLEAAFGSSPERLVNAAARLGGRRVEGGDVAVDLPALPRVALRVLLWAASDEFPASANLLVDARAHLHLPLDVLWALSNLAIHDLVALADAPPGPEKGSIP